MLEAKDVPEALEVAQQHRGTIHLLVTDMVMPGMSGRELAAQLVPLRPALKVVYLWGYTEYSTARQDELSQNEALLPKPFTRSTLARTVRELLCGGKVN